MTKAKKTTKTQTKKPAKQTVKKAESVADILRRRQAEADTKKEPAPKKDIPKKTETKLSDEGLNSNFGNLQNIPEYLEFIDFMATPKELRELETMGDFSKKFGIHRDTLTNWKNRQGFWEDVRDARRKYIKENILGTAIVALKKAILKDGKAPEVKLLFQLADEFEEKSSVEVKKPSRLTDEQKRGFGERLARWKAINLKTD